MALMQERLMHYSLLYSYIDIVTICWWICLRAAKTAPERAAPPEIHRPRIAALTRALGQPDSKANPKF